MTYFFLLPIAKKILDSLQRPRFKLQLDFIIICMLIGFALIAKPEKYIASNYSYYQAEFGPAIMLACGHGYVNTDKSSSAVTDFLSRKTEKLNCADVPAQSADLTALQHSSLYLMGSVGLYWKISGISWQTLTPYIIFFYLLTILSAYALLRIILPPVPAGFGGWLLLPILTTYLFSFRDFSKALFIYCFFAGVVYLVTRWRSDCQKSLYIISALTGVSLGIGFGFRTDLMILIPLFLFCLMFFVPRPLTLSPTLDKTKAFGFFAASFMFFSLPIFWGLVKGSNLAHIFLLGRTVSFNDALGVSSAPYDVGFPYLDEFILSMTSAWTTWSSHSPTYFSVDTQEYDKAAMHLSKTIIQILPADLFIQMIGSIIKVMSTWAPLFIISFVGLAIRNRRYFMFSFFCFIFLAGYPFLQFNERHFFYLQILYGVALYGTFDALFRLHKFFRSPQMSWSTAWTHNLRPALGVASGIITIYAAFLFGTRLWQQQQLEHQLHLYQNAQVTQEGIVRAEDAEWVYFHVMPTPEHGTAGEYLSLKFSPYCNQNFLHIRMGYKFPLDNGTVRTFEINPTRHLALYFPAVTLPGMAMIDGATFTIIIDKSAEQCLSSLSKFVQPEKFQLPLTWLVHKDKQNFYQQLTLFNPLQGNKVIHNITELNELNCVLKSNFCGILDRLVLIPTNEYSAFAEGVYLEKNVLLVDSNLGRYKSLTFFGIHEVTSNDDYFIIEGDLVKGEVLIGLLDNSDTWRNRITVNQLGKFRVIIRASKGIYKVLMEGGPDRTKLNITRAGWASGHP